MAILRLAYMSLFYIEVLALTNDYRASTHLCLTGQIGVLATGNEICGEHYDRVTTKLCKGR